MRFAILLFVAGCNRTNYNVAPVHGTVSVDNKPLTRGMVMFAPIAPADRENPGKPAYGHIQTNGDYRLKTFEKDDGAVVGEHWVTILNTGEDLPDGVPEFSRITLPEKMKVLAGRDNKLDINFTSQIVKKYRGDNR